MILSRIFDPVTLKYYDESTPEYPKIKKYVENKRLRDKKPYECRTGHETQSVINGREYLDEIVEYRYIIVSSSTSKILVVWEYTNGPEVELVGGNRYSEVIVHGYGETEDNAWNMALEDIV